MSIKNLNQINNNDINLTVQDSNEKILRTVTLNGLNIPDGQLINFHFAPILESKNQEYKVILTSSNSVSENAFEIFYTKTAPDWIGELSLNSEPYDGKLSLVRVQNFSGVNSLDLVNDVYKSWLHKFLVDPVFSGFYLIIFTSLVIGFFRFRRIS